MPQRESDDYFQFSSQDPFDPAVSDQLLDKYYKEQLRIIDEEHTRRMAIIRREELRAHTKLGLDRHTELSEDYSAADTPQSDYYSTRSQIKDSRVTRSNDPDRMPLWQQVTGSVVAAAVVGGIAVGWYESRPEATEIELNRLDSTTASLYIGALLGHATADITSYYSEDDAENVTKLKDALSKVTSIDVPTSNVFKSVLSDAQAAAYLGAVSDSEYGEYKELTKHGIKDIAQPDQDHLLAAAETEWFVSQIAQAEYAVDADGYNKFRTDLAKSKVSAENKQLLNRYIDAVQANSISITVRDSLHIEDEDLPKQITEIKDTELRDNLQAVYETALADDIATQILNYYLTSEDATELSKRITNKSLQGMVTDIIKLADPISGSDPNAATILTDQLSQASSDASQALDDVMQAATDAVSDLENAVDIESTTLKNKYATDSAAVQAQLAKLVIAHNHLQATKPFETLPPTGIAPSTTIDLNGVKGKSKIPDLDDASHSDFDYAHVPEFNEFASVAVVNGRLVLDFHANDKLTEAAKQQISAVFRRVQPLLEASFASGELNAVRFVTGEFDPYYLPSIREEIMVLPSDDSLSVDELSSVWTHETIHSLVRNVFLGETGAAQQKLIVQTCNQIQDTVYNQLENTINATIDNFNALIAQVKPEHAIIFKQMLKAAQAGTIDAQMDADTADLNSFYSNACDEGDNVVGKVIYELASKNKIADTDFSYVNDLSAYKKFADSWGDSLSYGLLYAQLNESNFVDTKSIDGPYLGHSQDDANEMTASLLDAMLNYPAKLGQAIMTMSPDQQTATLDALQAFCTIVDTAHGSLSTIINDAHKIVLSNIK